MRESSTQGGEAGLQLWEGAGVATGDTRQVSRGAGSTVSLCHTEEAGWQSRATGVG